MCRPNVRYAKIQYNIEQTNVIAEVRLRILCAKEPAIGAGSFFLCQSGGAGQACREAAEHIRAVFRLQKIRMARVCSMSLFAVKRYCHRAAECKSVSDVCRQKVLPRGEALRLANVRSPQSLCMSRLHAAPVECREQALLLFGYADVCGAAVAVAAALEFCLSQRFDVRGRRLACVALFSCERWCVRRYSKEKTK